MYEKYLVVIPLENEGVTVKKIKGVRYVYYTFDRNYSYEKMIKSPDGEYCLNYAVSATQTAILKAFGMTSDNIKKQAKELGTDLKQ